MNIYQHFRPDEREFIDQVLQWKRLVEDTFVVKLTDFLDPRGQQIVRMIVGETNELQCLFFGGIGNSERKRALIIPNYFNGDDEEFQVSLFEVDYPKKFVKIEHPQVLGSLMSLGLKRDKFGDILIHEDRIQFVVAREISAYIQLQLTSIGRAKITVNEIPLSEAISIKDQWSEIVTTISSLRLDTVISALYNLSRQKSQLLIEHGHVKVNYGPIEKPAFECGLSDMISVRGYGRTKILSIDGITKKGKWRIIAGKQK